MQAMAAYYGHTICRLWLPTGHECQVTLASQAPLINPRAVLSYNNTLFPFMPHRLDFAYFHLTIHLEHGGDLHSLPR